MCDHNSFIIKIIFNFKGNVCGGFSVRENSGMVKHFLLGNGFSNNFMVHTTCVKITKNPPHKFVNIFTGFGEE